MEPPTEQEVEQVEQLRTRITELWLSKEDLQDKNLVRWLRARKHNLEAAEVMLRKHYEWRKTIDIESLVREEDPEGWDEQYRWHLCGFDKDNNPVSCVPLGTWDMRGAMAQGLRTQWERYVTKLLERTLRNCRFLSKDREWMGQLVVIYDFSGLSFSQVTCYEAAQATFSIAHTFNDNYPELLRRLFVVNTPTAFQILYKLLRPVLDQRTMEKVMILGSDASVWRTEIGKLVALDQFPKKYGGEGDDLFEMGMNGDGEPFVKVKSIAIP